MAAPVVMPVTAAVVELTDTLVAALLHTPPAGVMLSVAVLPKQMVVIVLISTGTALTVMIAVAEQPDIVYDTVVVPAPVAVTTPVPVHMAAMPVVPPPHTPPVVASLSVVVRPAHKLKVPVMAAGEALTVIDLVTVQPDPSE
jgi:hypothetical protein